MRRMMILLAALVLAGPARAAPVVVELFQSQGCSSCPPANANVNAIAGRPGVLALSFGVTYWDSLGWKDTFASKAFTERQYAYARGLGRSNVATPQVVVNGRIDLVGGDRAALERAIRRAGPVGPARVAFAPGAVSIAAGAAPWNGADVWLVRYDPRILSVPIKRGENNGKTLPHRNIVRELVRLGGWTGTVQTFRLAPPRDPAWRTAVLVQAAGGGAILGAAAT